MKRWIYIVIATVLLAGCEVIGENERLIPTAVDIDAAGKAHVLIEYTGFRCVNCPKAAEVAESLHQAYGEQLIVVAMHPASNPFTQGVAEYDYTSPAADIYYRDMGGNATTPFPTGNLNMQRDADGYLHDYTLWPTMLAAVAGEKASVFVHPEATYNESTHQVTVRTTCYAEQPYDGQLLLWLVEDSIQGAQLMPDGTVSTQYYHRHVLRQALTEPYGQTMAFAVQPTTHELQFALPEQYDRTHCSIVALVLNTNTAEIINARQTPIQ